MRTRTATRYALFLVLLVLGQEFSSARYTPEEGLLVNGRTTLKRDDTFDDEFNQDNSEDYKKELQLLDQARIPSDNEIEDKIDEDEEDEEDDEREKGIAVVHPQKRGWALAILAVQLAFSAASLGLEIYYKIKGCCGTHPDACKYRDQFTAIQKRLGPLSKATDKIALNTVNLKEDVIQSNYQLISIWKSMRDIDTFEEEIVTALTPEIIKSFNNKWDAIKSELKKKNKTVQALTYNELNIQFRSYFDDFESTMISMSTWMGYGLIAASMKAFKVYKQNQINLMVDKLSTGEGYNMLLAARRSKGAKTMTYNRAGLQRFIRQHATIEVNHKFGGKKLGYVLNGINVIAGVISTGFEVYAMIMKIKQCTDIQNRAHDSVKNIRKMEISMKEVKQNVTDYYNFLQREGWDNITAQVTTASFHKTVKDIQELVVNADKKSPALQAAITNMGIFLESINSTISNSSLTFKLLKNLATGLDAVKFKMSCYVNRVRLLKHVTGQCQNGTASLPDLYSKAVQTFGVVGKNCIVDSKGTPYTSYKQVLATVTKVANMSGYNADCILNDKAKLREACNFNKEGRSKKYIGEQMKLTADQVQYFLDRCPEPELTPKEKANICFMKSLGVSAQRILGMMSNGITLKTVQDYMDNNC